MKKCLGCGSILQCTDINGAGYTPKLENDLCMRCFKLKHYNTLLNSGKSQDNESLLKSINKRKNFVVFLIDFLNIYENIIDIYKRIKNPKCLVITKSDLIPKNIKKDRLINNIRDIYDIKEEIILTSSKTKMNFKALETLCLTHKNVLFTGFTNAGKSSLINALIGSNITVSKKVNTTQEFIDLKFSGIKITDAPGFINKNYLDDVPSSIIKPITYQLDAKYYLTFADITFASEVNNNLTIYISSGLKVAKRRIKSPLSYSVIVPSNSDLIIKGLGFIKIKTATKVYISLDKEYYEIRPSIIGGAHE